MTDAVEVSGLRVVAPSEGQETAIVEDVSFSIARGEVMALIGESGSGKTTVALATMGYSRSGCRIVAGSVNVFGTEVLSLDSKALRALRGSKIAYIAQSAAASFNPSRSIMGQVIESALIHGTMTAAAARTKARRLFRELALPDPDAIGDRYPHQVSGGQLQRLLAAMALINDPELVIFDEPTTALDVTTQVEVLRAFKAVIRNHRMTGIYVSHDLAVVAQIADKVAVLRAGRLQETGSIARIVEAPENDYTRALIKAASPTDRIPAGEPVQDQDPPLLQARGIVAGYGRRGPDGQPAIRVLENVGFTLRRGSTVGVIGESGSGKSTLARVVSGLNSAASGEVRLAGVPLAADLGSRTRDQLRRIQIVFQSADTSLNPARTIGQILERPLSFYHKLSGREQRQRARRLLDMVKLPLGVEERLPAELSGGQKQRVNLARALAAEPDVILCDEVTSALDTVVGEAVLDLLVELQRELGISYLFISHDLGVVRSVSNEVLVLRNGRVVETGPTDEILRAPRDAYTRLLITSKPELRLGWLDELEAPAVSFSPARALT